MFKIYFLAKFHMPTASDSSVIANNPNAKETLHDLFPYSTSNVNEMYICHNVDVVLTWKLKSIMLEWPLVG